MDTSKLKEISSLLRKANTIMVTAHIRPDGDAIGSVSGFCKAMQSLGKKVEAVLVSGVPSRFSFAWPKNINLIQNDSVTLSQDLLVVLDSGDEERTGVKFTKSSAKTKIINIDHHASNTEFGDINYVDAKASSTCEIITQLLEAAEITISSDMATSLMMGLITDSRCFQNEGIRPETYDAAGILTRAGADTVPIFNMFNCDRREKDLRVLGFGLNNFQLKENGILGTLIIKQSDLKKLGAGVDSVYGSGIFNIMLTIKNTKVCVVTFEREDGTASCEFRSRGGINVKDTAVALGGGGHLAASGCSQNIPIDELAYKAEKLLKEELQKHKEG